MGGINNEITINKEEGQAVEVRLVNLALLEIESPGILPFGMSMGDFKSGLSQIRSRGAHG